MAVENDTILNARGFGISNGVITIVALIAGFYATHTPKIGIIGALLSLLITDPLGDSYSIYIAMRDRNERVARATFFGTWKYQVIVQALFLTIVFCTSTTATALVVSSICGTLLIFYDLTQRLPSATLVLREYAAMVVLIVFTFAVDAGAYRLLNGHGVRK